MATFDPLSPAHTVDYRVHTVRVEVEMNLNWAEANPELFAARVSKFQNEYNTGEWKMSMDLTRNRYMTLVAEKAR